MQDISNFITNGISAVLNWFDQLMSAVPGLWVFLSSFLLMSLLTRFLIVPIMGKMNLGSDGVNTGAPRSRFKGETSRSNGESSGFNGESVI